MARSHSLLDCSVCHVCSHPQQVTRPSRLCVQWGDFPQEEKARHTCHQIQQLFLLRSSISVRCQRHSPNLPLILPQVPAVPVCQDFCFIKCCINRIAPRPGLWVHLTAKPSHGSGPSRVCLLAWNAVLSFVLWQTPTHPSKPSPNVAPWGSPSTLSLPHTLSGMEFWHCITVFYYCGFF